MWKIKCFALFHAGKQIKTQRAVPEFKRLQSDFWDIRNYKWFFRNTAKERAKRGNYKFYHLVEYASGDNCHIHK